MKLLLITVCIVGAAFAANISRNLNSSSDGTRQLRFIGTVEGKSFFFDDENYVNWRAAGNFCAEAGMHLASLETEAQYNFIKDSTDSLFLSAQWFWTSGRDSQDLNQIKWNDTDTAASASYMNVTTALNYYLSCLRLRKRVDDLQFVIVNCETDTNYPLCET